MERGYLEDQSVDDKRIFTEYGGRRGGWFMCLQTGTGGCSFE